MYSTGESYNTFVDLTEKKGNLIYKFRMMNALDSDAARRGKSDSGYLLYKVVPKLKLEKDLK